MLTPQRVILIFAVLLLGVSGFLYGQRQWVSAGRADRLMALLAGQETLSLDVRTKAAACAVRGPLPDHACTPGAVFADATAAKICTPGYSKSVRSVTQKVHEQVFAEYGFGYPQPYGSFEVDHLIPLELGGSNDVANLFPEAADPAPGFHEKDLVENYLHEEVCAGRVELSVAQDRISHDWLAIYNGLSPDDIRRLKAEFAGWAN
ncbi:MAG: HNH endonuclease [Patescibacteria group bacterium]|nr:HNH endonuclease [Patescibacteria group bacterium]